MSNQPQEARIILRRKQVEARTGLPTSTLYLLMSKSQFPRPVALGVRAVGWNSAEVDAWIAERLTKGPEEYKARPPKRRTKGVQK